MTLPRIVSEEEWTAARRVLLDKEKTFTRQRDELNTERRELPMVEVTKPYEFEGPNGTLSLLDLFEGRRQLIVYHFMFHPDWDEGCSSCTAGTDELAPGLIEHLNIRDTTYALVSRAPLAKLERWKTQRGWTIPWYSTNDGDFSYDFGATIDASRGYDEFNYRADSRAPAAPTTSSTSLRSDGKRTGNRPPAAQPTPAATNPTSRPRPRDIGRRLRRSTERRHRTPARTPGTRAQNDISLLSAAGAPLAWRDRPLWCPARA